LKELGPNPDGGAIIKLMRGRYGPYVTDGDTNATVPNATDPLSLTLDQAIALIAERAAKGGGKKAKKPARTKAKTSSKKKNEAAVSKAKAGAKKKTSGTKAASKPTRKATAAGG
jgi:DNA topoisomerase-1